MTRQTAELILRLLPSVKVDPTSANAREDFAALIGAVEEARAAIQADEDATRLFSVTCTAG
jgi:hypothetical protein